MCFSEQVSLQTFLIGCGFSSFIFFTKDTTNKILGSFFFFVSLMQGIEFLLWRNQECNEINKAISVTGMILNYLQVPFLIAMVFLFNKQLSHRDKMILLIILAIYLCVYIFYGYKYITNVKCSLQGSNNHVIWQWHEIDYGFLAFTVYILAACIALYIGLPKIKLLSCFVGVASLITSKIIYPNNTGALWCFYIAFLPLLYYLYILSYK